MSLREAIREAGRPAARSPRTAKAGNTADRAPVDRLLAKLQSGDPILGEYRRWEYSWKEAEILADLTFQEKVGGLEGSAVNLVEADNQATVVANGVDPANFLGSFDVVKAGGFVWLYPTRDADGNLVWTFSALVIDGSCGA